MGKLSVQEFPLAQGFARRLCLRICTQPNKFVKLFKEQKWCAVEVLQLSTELNFYGNYAGYPPRGPHNLKFFVEGYPT
jgi:hypothetical protein